MTKKSLKEGAKKKEGQEEGQKHKTDSVLTKYKTNYISETADERRMQGGYIESQQQLLRAYISYQKEGGRR